MLHVRGEFMSTLLLRLAAPIQSWGVSSKFNRRMSNLEPTRSGVIGLVAAAMGRGREESLENFKLLKFGVRIDQPGRIGKDFQMVHSDGGKNSSWLTDRYYLEDAVFLAALEGKNDFLRSIEWALKNPVYPLFLGRRSCPPAGQLCLGMRETGMRDSLRQEAWQASPWYQRRAKYRKINNLEIVRDAEFEENAYTLRDEPKSFSQLRRRYDFRNVIREHIPLQAICKDMGDTKGNDISTEHDPMALWEGYDVSFKSED